MSGWQIDGQTSRCSKGKISEFAAIPKLLDLLATKGALMTIDAMGSQRPTVKEHLRAA
jgi:predicted transposase YbfD/YdcC